MGYTDAELSVFVHFISVFAAHLTPQGEAHTHTHTHTLTYAYAYTCTHTHTHTYSNSFI